MLLPRTPYSALRFCPDIVNIKYNLPFSRAEGTEAQEESVSPPVPQPESGRMKLSPELSVPWMACLVVFPHSGYESPWSQCGLLACRRRDCRTDGQLPQHPFRCKARQDGRGNSGKRAAPERSQVGMEQGGSQSNVRICEESHQYAGTLLPYICGLFFLGGLVCMDWDDWWSKPSSLQRTNMFGQICFFHKYSGVPRSWVVRTMNISPLLRTKGNVFMTDSSPV